MWLFAVSVERVKMALELIVFLFLWVLCRRRTELARRVVLRRRMVSSLGRNRIVFLFRPLTLLWFRICLHSLRNFFIFSRHWSADRTTLRSASLAEMSSKIFLFRAEPSKCFCISWSPHFSRRHKISLSSHKSGIFTKHTWLENGRVNNVAQ